MTESAGTTSSSNCFCGGSGTTGRRSTVVESTGSEAAAAGGFAGMPADAPGVWETGEEAGCRELCVACGAVREREAG